MKNVNFIALPNSLDKYVVGEDAVVYERSFGTGELKRLERVTIGKEAGYFLDWVSGKAFYEMHFLYVVSYFARFLPSELYHEVIAVRNEKLATGVFDANVFLRFKSVRIEIPDLVGFFYIPYYTRYATNELGDVYDLKLKRLKYVNVVKPQKGDPKNRTLGYRFYTAYSDDGLSILYRHRAIGLAIIGYPENPRMLVMNHLNGTPGDDRVENLEWTTRAKNNVHAIQSGLTPNSVRKVDAHNVFTGEEASFISIAEAARTLTLSETVIRSRLSEQKGYVYQDGWVLKDSDSTLEIKDDRIKALNDTGSFRVLARNITTNQTLVFDSIADASSCLGICHSAIRTRLVKETNRPFMNYVFRYHTVSRTAWPEFDSYDLAIYREYPHSGGVGFFITKNDEERFYPSVSLAGEALGLSEITMTKVAAGSRNLKGCSVRVHKPAF